MAQQGESKVSFFKSFQTWAPAVAGLKELGIIGLAGLAGLAGFEAFSYYRGKNKKQEKEASIDSCDYEYEIGNNNVLIWTKEDCEAIEAYTNEKPKVMRETTTKTLWRFQVVPLSSIKEKEDSKTGQLNYANMNTIPEFPELIHTLGPYLEEDVLNPFGLDDTAHRIRKDGPPHYVPADTTHGISCVSSLEKLSQLRNVFKQNCVWINNNNLRKMDVVLIISELPIKSKINSKFIAYEDNADGNPAHVIIVPTVSLTSKEMESIVFGFGNGFSEDNWKPRFALRLNLEKSTIGIEELQCDDYENKNYDIVVQGAEHAHAVSQSPTVRTIVKKDDVLFMGETVGTYLPMIDNKKDEKDEKDEKKDRKENKNKNKSNNNTKKRTNSNNNEKKSEKENVIEIDTISKPEGDNLKREVSSSRSQSVTLGSVSGDTVNSSLSPSPVSNIEQTVIKMVETLLSLKSGTVRFESGSGDLNSNDSCSTKLLLPLWDKTNFPLYYDTEWGRICIDTLIEKAKNLSDDCQFDILFGLQDIMGNRKTQLARDCLTYCLDEDIDVEMGFRCGSLFSMLTENE